ncbi:hypothetical protein HZ993_09030 [Rhodoferax sp. AJA081-3]|uniref:DUF5916 domain-containing protein n=1 Tax=Rhodoferax sp. AJA081-3 TaxID=2752316 RepID=UPI001AE03D36|nr:DUF5916 domain-containing protein [Rhodoferax sp. AJA081-3]QTN29929.1 hypothetical protein HZ993_09030 [Rhodoferax sp. AJA081-3]
MLNDAAWAAASPYTTFRRFRPDTELDVGPYRTEVRVLMERGALVFGIRAWDPNPQDVRAPLARRDKIHPDQDAVTVWLDPTGRAEVAQFVRVNAAGSMSDGVYRASDDEEDESADYHDVEVASHRLADGYSVEIRWPLSVLRYPLNGKLPWGLMVTRRVPRDISMAFASAPMERNQPHMLTQLQRFDVDAPLREQLNDEQHLRIRAEGTARTLDDGAGTRESTVNLGLELQWRPRADWVVDAIFRPDFSQVELDEPQLAGNTRFALFQTEKRTFFLESSDVVGQVPPDNWDVSRGLLAFYSRAITDPRWGLRSTYRGNETEGTALVLHDAGGGLILRPNAFGTASYAVDQPSNVFFARHRTQVSERSSLAGILSTREWSTGVTTQLAGFDGQVDLDDVNQVRGHFLQSQDTTALPPHGDLAGQPIAQGPAQTGQASWLSWRHRGDDWRWVAHYEHISPRFVNDNGFVPQSGIQRTSLEVTRIVPTENKAISTLELTMRGMHTGALQDLNSGVLSPQLAGELVQPGIWILSAAGTEGWAHLNLDRARTRFDGVVHQARSLLIGGGIHPGPRLTFVNLEATLGDRIDVDADRVGQGYNLSSQVTWRDTWGPYGLELEQHASVGRISGPNGSAALQESSAQTKLILHLSAEQAIRLVHQNQTFNRAGEANLTAAQSNTRVTTLAWLARRGALRGWSLGASWAQESAQAAKQELFVKFQQGWSWH